jgi:hypothetical protein
MPALSPDTEMRVATLVIILPQLAKNINRLTLFWFSDEQVKKLTKTKIDPAMDIGDIVRSTISTTRICSMVNPTVAVAVAIGSVTASRTTRGRNGLEAWSLKREVISRDMGMLPKCGAQQG